MTSILPGHTPWMLMPLTIVPRTRIAVLRSVDDAEPLAEALRAQGIEALVEIDDLQLALPGQSVLPGLLAFPGPMFAYPLTVPIEDRDRAMAILDGMRGARSQPTSTRTLLRGGAIALGLGAAALVLRVALG